MYGVTLFRRPIAPADSCIDYCLRWYAARQAGVIDRVRRHTTVSAMKIELCVIYEGQEMLYDMSVGDGRMTIKWLGEWRLL